MSRFLSPRQVAEYLNVSYDVVLDLIHAGELPKRDVSVGRGKPRYRVAESEIEDFLNRRTEHREPRKRRKIRKPKRDYFSGKV